RYRLRLKRSSACSTRRQTWPCRRTSPEPRCTPRDSPGGRFPWRWKTDGVVEKAEAARRKLSSIVRRRPILRVDPVRLCLEGIGYLFELFGLADVRVRHAFAVTKVAGLLPKHFRLGSQHRGAALGRG